jgi:cytidylate kinase
MGFAEQQSRREEDVAAAIDQIGESPRHGFRGDQQPDPSAATIPAALTVAISREAGSRGQTVGTRAAQKLGWPVYNQELLEYIAQEGAFRQKMLDQLTPAAAQWAEERLQQLLRDQKIDPHPTILELARMVVALGAQGEVVLIGRGAGLLLPRASTLHVRIIAPLQDRIAYMAQWLRLTVEEAAEQVRLRDARRAEFLANHFYCQPGDIYQYDLLLNSSLLGEDLCADLIVQAARAKLAARSPAGAAPPEWAPEAAR